MSNKFVIVLFVAAAAWVGAGCDGGPRSTSMTTNRITHGASYGTDSADQRRFKEAVAAAKIPHEIGVEGGQEVVRWTDEHHPAMLRIQESLFGPPMPPGSNRSYGDGNDAFKAWLTANGIPFKASISHGREYVIWAVEDDPRVAKYEVDCKAADGQGTAGPAPTGQQGKVPPPRRGCGPPAR